MSRFELIMSILTSVAALIAGITGIILWKQVGQMRIDQRAWIAAHAIGEPHLVPNEPLSITVKAENTGKTVAKDFDSYNFIDVVKNGESPDFDYARPNRNVVRVYAADRFPNEALTIPLARSTPGKEEGQGPTDIPLTVEEYNQLTGGAAYVAAYGKITYKDIFHVQHWKAYCMPFVFQRGTYTTAKCVQRNDQDDN
jgi:hypothetical protein